jgi:hypothetical protein
MNDKMYKIFNVFNTADLRYNCQTYGMIQQMFSLHSVYIV